MLPVFFSFFFFLTSYFFSLQTIVFLHGKSVLLPQKFAFSWTIPMTVHQSKQFREKPLGLTADKCLIAFVTDPGFHVGECTGALTPTFSTLIIVLSTTETNIQNLCTVTTVTAFHNGTIYMSKIARLGTGYYIYVYNPRTDTSNLHLGSGVGLNAAHIPLSFVCCLEFRAIIWWDSRQIIHLSR